MDLEKVIGNAHALDLRASRDQEKLTRRHLKPRLEAVVDRLRQFRKEIDEESQVHIEAARAASKESVFGDIDWQRYPIGFCKHIRERVLGRMIADPLIQELVMRGLTLRRVFIFQEGLYFQNAIQFGNYYLDAANDTVYPEKPKLHWSHIDELNFENLDSWERFEAVARGYLKIEVFPNFVFPFGFPASPFFAIRPNGRLDLLLAQHQILMKDLGDGMRRTLALLDNQELMNRQLPEFYAERLKQLFGGNLMETFPLEYAPCDADHIRRTIIPEFQGLLNQPKEEAFRTTQAYLDLITKAMRRLRRENICPDASELSRLREAGLVPADPFAREAVSVE